MNSNTSRAATTNTNLPEKIKAVQTDQGRGQIDILDASTLMKPSAVKELTASEKAQLYATEREKWGERHIGLHLVSRLGQVIKKEDTTTAFGLGLIYSQDVDFDHGFDYSMEVLNSNLLALQMAQRNYFVDYDRLYLPYWKFGLGTAYLGSEGVATLFDLKKLNLFISAGLADLTNDNKKFYLEFGAGYSMIGTQLWIASGINRNF